MTTSMVPVSVVTAGVLSALHRTIFHEDPWDTPAIAGIMRIAGFFGRIASENEQPIGFVMALDLGEESEIVSLGVLPERRRAGCGSALLAAICREAKLRGSRSLVLEVAIDNIAARAFYDSRGFTPVSLRLNYYRRAERLVDALILRLALIGT
ncbi:MAG: GNAT family N-acetyltransferase [Alphaproteobacteria bacterium]|nr:GNAT family N-acetyltransferase [Alphaproteobacteria bacterium]